MSINCSHVPVIDVDHVIHLFRERYESVWRDLDVCPRTCASDGARRCTYFRWFRRPDDVSFRRSYLHLCMSGPSMQQLLRFRVGSHHLPVEVGRRSGVPRAARLCPLCSTGMPGDERHMVFECPALQPVFRSYLLWTHKPW